MEYALVTKSWHKLTMKWLVSLDLKMACQKYVVYNNLPGHPTYYEESGDENENPEDLKETSSYNADVIDSSFYFTQLELDLPDVQEVKDKHTDASETDLKCKKCDYKCKRENTLKKHINTKHS